MMNDKTETIGETSGGDDISGLIQKHLTNREDRNAVELEAISHAYDKYVYRAKKKKRRSGWLTDEFIRRVHFDMFGSIWDWGGKYRSRNMNVGVPHHQIQEQIKMLCDDFQLWDSSNEMPTLEIAARLQNRLTKVHPFKNGNGRHARLITDIFFKSRDQNLPIWPQVQLMTEGDRVRAEYIAAMRKADEGDFSLLSDFIGGLIPRQEA